MNAASQSGWVQALYDQRAAALILYGRTLGLSHSEAEDVLHETFAALLALTSEPTQPVAYLLRTFRNRAHNHRRGWWRRLARELEASRWFEPADPHDPREDHLEQALTRLPPDQREVIVLKVWQRLTFAAIAEVLALSPNTVAGRYRYGLERLRRLLGATPHELDQVGDPAASFPEAAPAFPRP